MTTDENDGRHTRCLICDAGMYRYEVRPHEWACARIGEGLEREPAPEPPVAERLKRRRKAYVPGDE